MRRRDATDIDARHWKVQYELCEYPRKHSCPTLQIYNVVKPVSEQIAEFISLPDRRGDLAYQHAVLDDLKLLHRLISVRSRLTLTCTPTPDPNRLSTLRQSLRLAAAQALKQFQRSVARSSPIMSLDGIATGCADLQQSFVKFIALFAVAVRIMSQTGYRYRYAGCGAPRKAASWAAVPCGRAAACARINTEAGDTTGWWVWVRVLFDAVTVRVSIRVWSWVLPAPSPQPSSHVDVDHRSSPRQQADGIHLYRCISWEMRRRLTKLRGLPVHLRYLTPLDSGSRGRTRCVKYSYNIEQQRSENFEARASIV